MTKQLSRCCKAEIELTGEDRPNHFKCGECGRIIGEPYEIKYIVREKDLQRLGTHLVEQRLTDKINELIDAVKKIQEWGQTPALDKYTIDSLLLQVSQQQEAIDDMKEQISQLWNTGFSKMDKLAEIDHISDTGNYMCIGNKVGVVDNKLIYSKDEVEQEAKALSRDNDIYRAGIKYAVERYNTLYLENVQTVMDLYYYKEITNKRKKEMKSIYDN